MFKLLPSVIVLSHDETLERTFGVCINVRKSTWSQLRNVERGKYRVATLRGTLETIAGAAGVFTEVENPQDTGFVLEVVRESEAEKWTAVISFYREIIREVHIHKDLIYAKPPGGVIEAKKLSRQLVLPYFRLATVKSINLAHRLGLYVVTWTVNDVTKAVELWNLGADGIATDDVENIKKFLK